MRFAVIGSDHGHVFTFVEHMLQAGGEFAGVWDDGHPHSRTLSEKYGVPFFATPEEAAEAGIGLAGCFGPNGDRIGIAEICAARGVHVMSDKPFALSENDLARLRKMTDGGIAVGLMYTLRFEKSVRAMKALFESGELGELVCMEIVNPHQLHPGRRPDWFYRKEHGTVAQDLFTHSVDLFRWFTDGAPWTSRDAAVIKSLLPEEPAFADIATAHVTAASGVTGYFRVDWHMPESHWNWGDCRVCAVGTKGMAEARVTGDPLTRREMLIVYSPERGTFEADLETAPLAGPTADETADLLARIRKEAYTVSQEDILESCRETLALDACARYIDRTAKGGAR